ncbi:hypothetical protein DOY81_012846, partial [Sarcophaga bullata]
LMAFNLNILPLDNIYYQKCLIPKDKFPSSARPGQWAKCYFRDGLNKELQNCAVAQIFPRDEIGEVCLLDTSITEVDITDDRPIVLEDIVLLKTKNPFTSARKELDNIIQLLKFQRSQKRAIRLNLNVLLVGAVGSGKNYFIGNVFKDHHCNVFQIEITQCLKQYPGETEAELKKNL